MRLFSAICVFLTFIGYVFQSSNLNAILRATPVIGHTSKNDDNIITGESNERRSNRDEAVSAVDFGLKCNGPIQAGGAANTIAILLAAKKAAAGRGTVILPEGTCIVKPVQVPDGVRLLGQGQTRTRLEVVNDITELSIIKMSSGSVLQGLTVNGNRLSQTTGHCGVWGDRVRDVKIIDVTIEDVLGKGDCFQDSYRILHLRETVRNTGRPSPLTETSGSPGMNGSGFWVASYTHDQYFYDGMSWYIDCDSAGNDLDGLEFGINNILIRGGKYHDNGRFTDLTPIDQDRMVHTRLLQGALGAAGIYFATDTGTPPAARGAVIEGVEAYGNSESGLDLMLGVGSVVADNASHDNGTFGFSLNGKVDSTLYLLIDNIAYSNGRSTNRAWARGNPTYMLQAGFSFAGIQSYATIIGNKTIVRGKSGETQRWGMYAQRAALFGEPMFDHFEVVGNLLEGNTEGRANFDGSSGPVPPQMRDLGFSH